jgi:hypothetical protein
VLYALFCTGFCAIKTGLTRRYLAWAGSAFLLASAGLFLFSVPANPPHITSFYINKASLTGIRWPNGKLWLVGAGPEKASFSTFERVIIPWMRQNLCHNIDAIVLTQDPCNAVQSLEPLLKNAGVKTVMALSSEEPSCADFSLFLAEFGMSLQTVDQGVPVIPAPRCTCMLMPRIVQNEEPVQPFKISVYNSTIIMPDNVLSASENKGAVSLIFSKGREPRLKQEISASHPLSPNVY